MSRFAGSVAFRVSLGYGALVISAMIVISTVFYFGTVGVIGRGIDAKLLATSHRLTNHFDALGADALREGIEQLLTDGVDQDTEVYLLLDAEGRPIVGNLSALGVRTPLDQLTDQAVVRYGRPSESRLLSHRLSNGDLLIVGRDLEDVHAIEVIVWRALLIGAAAALGLAIGGAILFRRLLERRVAAIRRTAHDIASGDLSQRIPVDGAEDEFTRLNHDINRMLDRIQQLMDGVRDMSNAMAHDLRTPLGRLRSLLDGALKPGVARDQLRSAASASIQGIDDLILLFDKLLQIAEAESGTRRQNFRQVSLAEVITTVVELYDAVAESRGIQLTAEADDTIETWGDKDLLASATANLLDNALKYAGSSGTVSVSARRQREMVSIVIEDDGPGIPPTERAKVVRRFYRLDRSRNLPGNGLGLPIVAAVAHLHGGELRLEDATPGLRASIVLRHADPTSFPNRNVPDTRRIDAAG